MMSMCGKGIPIEVDAFEGGMEMEVEWKWKLIGQKREVA